MNRFQNFWAREFYNLRRFKYVKGQVLDRTMYWHDVLSDFIDKVPDGIPVHQYASLQELRRDIGHFRIDLLSNKMERIGHDFEKDVKN